MSSLCVQSFRLAHDKSIGMFLAEISDMCFVETSDAWNFQKPNPYLFLKGFSIIISCTYTFSQRREIEVGLVFVNHSANLADFTFFEAKSKQSKGAGTFFVWCSWIGIDETIEATLFVMSLLYSRWGLNCRDCIQCLRFLYERSFLVQSVENFTLYVHGTQQEEYLVATATGSLFSGHSISLSRIVSFTVRTGDRRAISYLKRVCSSVCVLFSERGCSSSSWVLVS